MDEIVRAHFETIDEDLLKYAMDTFYWIRSLKDIRKKPSTSELIDWLRALVHGGVDPEKIRTTTPYLGVLIKKDEDLEVIKKRRI
jgi:MoxR-like ATPase